MSIFKYSTICAVLLSVAGTWSSAAVARNDADTALRVLTGQWWQWAQPRDAFNSPAGPTNCRAGQSGLTWFLAGAFAADPENPLVRVCTQPIPQGKRLLFPLINAEVSANDCTEQRDPATGEVVQGPVDCVNVAQKRDVIAAVFDGDMPDLFFRGADFDVAPSTYACQLHASLNGETLFKRPGRAYLRVQSAPFALADDNEAIADGFWVLLPALVPGRYRLSFGGGLCLLESPPTSAAFLTGVVYEFFVQ